jgi:hypothetical protein
MSCAFVRRAPSVRLNSLEIFLTGNFSREYCFNDRRSSFVHSFRVRFVLLTIITPCVFQLLHNAQIVAFYKLRIYLLNSSFAGAGSQDIELAWLDHRVWRVINNPL